MRLIWFLIKFLLIIIFLGVLGSVGYWAYWQSQKSSTLWSLQSGIYQGILPSKLLVDEDGIIEGKRDFPLIIDYSQPPKLVILVKGLGIRPIVVDLSSLGSTGVAENKILLSSKKYRIELESPVASAIGLGNFRKYSGVAKNLDSGATANWQVEPVKEAVLSIAKSVEVAEFLRWYEYTDEIEELARSMRAAEVAAEQRQQEVDELEQLIGNRDRLAKYTDERMAELRTQLVDLQKDLQVQTKAHEQLAVEVQSAQNISPRGRLVNLTRELLQREAEVYRLKVNKGQSQVQFDPELLARGRIIKRMLDEIAYEQQRLSELNFNQ